MTTTKKSIPLAIMKGAWVGALGVKSIGVTAPTDMHETKTFHPSCDVGWVGEIRAVLVAVIRHKYDVE